MDQKKFLKTITKLYLDEFFPLGEIQEKYSIFNKQEIQFLLEQNGVKIRTSKEAWQAMTKRRKAKLEEKKPTKNQMVKLLKIYKTLPNMYVKHFKELGVNLNLMREWLKEYEIEYSRKYQTPEERFEKLMNRLPGLHE